MEVQRVPAQHDVRDHHFDEAGVEELGHALEEAEGENLEPGWEEGVDYRRREVEHGVCD